MEIEVMPEQTATLQGLLDVAVNLSAQRDRELLLEMILRESRKLARAEAGSLYVVQDGHLRFQVAQNDRICLPDVEQNLLGRDLPISSESLAGFVAHTPARCTTSARSASPTRSS